MRHTDMRLFNAACGANELKRRINPTRVPIEKKESIRWLDNVRQSTALLGDPDRCVHIGDRESDIYELFCLAKELGTHFLVRTCVDRLAGDGTHTVSDEMKKTIVRGVRRVHVRRAGRIVAAQDGDVLEQYDWELDKPRYIALLRQYDLHRDPRTSLRLSPCSLLTSSRTNAVLPGPVLGA